MKQITNPYELAADPYMETGIGWPIPSAYPLDKHPPLKGWTGKRGAIPDAVDILDWKLFYPQSNILLRLNGNVIGIDVDHYGDKNGGETLVNVRVAHGDLPPTWRSSARGFSDSGIYYYRLAGDMDERKAKGDFGPGSDIEIIRYSHRYAVVPPSWHQGAGAPYLWYDKVGRQQPPNALPPLVSMLPDLPQSWWEHITQKCNCFEGHRREMRHQIQRYKNRPQDKQGSALAELDFERGVRTLAQTPLGGRNNALSKLAGRTLLFDVFINEVLDVNEVMRKLHLAAATSGLDDDETQKTIESAFHWAEQMSNEGDK